MTRYFVKVDIIPTRKSYVSTTKTEFYGRAEFPFQSITALDKEELDIYGFKTKRSAEICKDKRNTFYVRDDSKFGNFIHILEIVERTI